MNHFILKYQFPVVRPRSGRRLQDGQRHQVALNGNLIDQGIYYYKLPVDQQDVLLHAVDIEVIKQRSEVSSQSTGRRDVFRNELIRRDGNQCVWTGLDGIALHIIPYSKGDQWLELIIANRLHGDEQNLDTLSINDIRNGITGADSLHRRFDSRKAVVLKIPNLILETTDVPEPLVRYDVLPGSNYPISKRFTLQWLEPPSSYLPAILRVFLNNSDAAFVSLLEPEPSDLLLHYNYGAAAVKNWGRNHAVLNNRPGLPRPPAFDPVRMGPTRSVGDRAKTIATLTKARAEGTQPQLADNGGSELSEAAIDSEQPEWDEDDVMLFFWGNSKPAMERHAKKAQERKENIDEWRVGVVVE